MTSGVKHLESWNTAAQVNVHGYQEVNSRGPLVIVPEAPGTVRANGWWGRVCRYVSGHDTHVAFQAQLN